LANDSTNYRNLEVKICVTPFPFISELVIAWGDYFPEKNERKESPPLQSP